MRRMLALLLFVLSLASAPAAAQTAIHRCIGADGNPVFTDQPCAALDATPLARSAQPTRESADTPTPAVLCAATIDALKRGVIEAFASRDANRMAGLMLWGGYGHGAAVADIRALQRAMREPLLDFGPAQESADVSAAPSAAGAAESNPFDGADATALAVSPMTAAPAPGNVLVVHTSASDGRGQSREMRFTVVRRSGCLWLRNAD